MNFDEFKAKYNVRLNEQQETAVRTVDGNILLLAVPGSGKTTVLVTRLAYMVECCGIQPEKILTMTYTVAATNDMKRRYCALFGDEIPRGLEFRTINSLCCEVIRSYEHLFGKQAFPLAEEEERAGIIAAVFREVNGEYATESDRRAVVTAITYAKNMLFSDEEIEHMKTDVVNFPDIFRKYKSEMIRRKLMDFDDQLCYACTILRRYPKILSYFRNRYTYICLDEAQDTSKIQHEIISLIAGDDGNLFMVGDEDQSIYAFRAAYPEALVHFETERKDAKVLLMEENFRSTCNITSAAEVFISQNQLRHKKHMIAARGEEGYPICQILLRSRKDQIDYILKTAVPEARSGIQTAILYRDNASALPVIDAFLRNGIPYSSRGLDSSFFSSRTVRDIKDIIRFAENPSDKELFLNIYYKINSYVDRKNAQFAAEFCSSSEDIPTWLFFNSNLKENIKKRQLVLKRQLETLLTLKGSQAIGFISDELGYGKFLEREKMSGNNLDILKILGENEPSPVRLTERLAELEQAVQQGATGEKNTIVLSTIHSAKGLEYERVYLMDIIDGILPQCGAVAPISEIEEERRLFYVAMTRAKNELFIFRFKKTGLTSDFSSFIFEKPFSPYEA